MATISVVRFGEKENDIGSFGKFFPGRYATQNRNDLNHIRDFVGIKEIELVMDITSADVQREVETLRSAQSPFVVKLIDFVQHPRDICWIVTEMCTCSLDDILQRRPAEFHYVKSGFRMQIPARFESIAHFLLAVEQIIKGLIFLHSRNIIHRDIKPSNILKSSDGVFKICDFGLAKFFESGAKHTTGKGTDWYNAPEKFNGGNYSIESDVYSTGICLIEGLALTVAKTHKDMKEYNSLSAAHKVFYKEYFVEFLNDNPVCSLAHAMMNKSPRLRPSLESALSAIGTNDYSPFLFAEPVPSSASSAAHVNVSVGGDQQAPATMAEQFAECFIRGDCRPGSTVTHSTTGTEHIVANFTRVCVHSHKMYFELVSGETGYMPLFDN